MPTADDDDCSSLGSKKERRRTTRRTKRLQPPSPMDEALLWDTDHVLAWRDADLPTPVYVRTDRSGAFHTYPALAGGPFQSYHETATAIDLHARGTTTSQKERKIALDKLSGSERAVQIFCYYPDGTRKIRTKRQRADLERDNVRRLVEAVLDKHNDVENHAYELEDVVHWQSICEGMKEWYYHLNITVKTKGSATGSGADLFFAEVSRDRNKDPGYFLSCFCRVKHDGNDNNGPCHGCTNNESVDMKHPRADLYTGGHMNIEFPLGFGPSNEMAWRNSESDPAEEAARIKAEEDRIRKCYDYLEDDEFLEEHFTKKTGKCW